MIYVPRQQVWNFGASIININSPTMEIVTEKLWVQGHAAFSVTHNNTRGLALNPGPSAGRTTAGLVQ